MLLIQTVVVDWSEAAADEADVVKLVALNKVLYEVEIDGML